MISSVGSRKQRRSVRGCYHRPEYSGRWFPLPLDTVFQNSVNYTQIRNATNGDGEHAGFSLYLAYPLTPRTFFGTLSRSLEHASTLRWGCAPGRDVLSLGKGMIMEPLSIRVIGRGQHLELQTVTVRGDDGTEVEWERVVRARDVRDIVGVFAVTEDRKVLLVEQYRPAIESYVLELPAGLCDVNGEPLLLAAQRELMEETGHRARQFWNNPQFWAVPASPECSGVLPTRFHLFVSQPYVYPVATEHTHTPDATERALDLHVAKFPVDDLAGALIHYELRTGRPVDAKILGGLAWWRYFNADVSSAANSGGAR